MPKQYMGQEQSQLMPGDMPMDMPSDMAYNDKQQEMMNVLGGMPVTERTNQPRMQDDTDILQILLTKEEFKNGEMLTDGLKKIASFYEKTLALSNIKREDIFWIKEGAKDLKVSYLMTRTKEKYTWEEEFLWTGFMQWLALEATRGVDGFERHMQATQISSFISNQFQGKQGGGTGGGILGFISRAFGTRG